MVLFPAGVHFAMTEPDTGYPAGAKISAAENGFLHTGRKRTPFPACHVKNIPHHSDCTGMECIRGVPNKYLYAVCLALSFLMFYAGGVAFSRSPFYGTVFFVLGVVLFFAAVRVGRKDFGQETADNG